MHFLVAILNILVSMEEVVWLFVLGFFFSKKDKDKTLSENWPYYSCSCRILLTLLAGNNIRKYILSVLYSFKSLFKMWSVAYGNLKCITHSYILCLSSSLLDIRKLNSSTRKSFAIDMTEVFDRKEITAVAVPLGKIWLNQIITKLWRTAYKQKT